MNKQYTLLAFLIIQLICICQSIFQDEVGKDLPTNYNNDDIIARRIIRPLLGGETGGGSGCNFNGIRRGKPKAYGSGRTFFDLQFINVGYHENYNIDCAGSGHPSTTAISGNHKPILGSHETGTQSQGGILSYKPVLSMILMNRPLQGLFSQSQSQSQTQTGVLGDAISGVTSLLPKPQDIGQGLGEGLSSFIQTIPQIGQSFQSLLPSFENFQLPSLPSFAQAGSQSMAGSASPTRPVTSSPTSAAGIVTPAAPDLVTEPVTVDPDFIIYNDNVKPVYEETDVVPGSNNKLPPGAYFNRQYTQNRYLSYKNYQEQKLNNKVNQNKYDYQRNRLLYNREPRFRQDVNIFSQVESRESDFDEDRVRSRGFRFPT